jgi:hypothetical protein
MTTTESDGILMPVLREAQNCDRGKQVLIGYQN